MPVGVSVCPHSLQADVNLVFSNVQLPLRPNPYRTIIYSCWHNIDNSDFIMNAERTKSVQIAQCHISQ